jgi:RNA polymerase-binding transcription factor DksA
MGDDAELAVETIGRPDVIDVDEPATMTPSADGSGLADQALDPDSPDEPRRSIDEVERQLDAVEAALARLDDGTFGVCERCGRPIGDARLSASPVATTCGSCSPEPSES